MKNGMKNRTAAGRWGIAALTVAALVAASLPAGSSAHSASTITTGAYVGKTSQGQVIKFKIARAKCDSPRPPYKFHEGICFEGELYNTKLQAYYPKVLEPCSDDTTYSDPLYAASYRLSLSSSGAMSYKVRGLGGTLTPNGSLTMISIQIKRGKATGAFRQTESYDSGNGPVYCDSKVVKFTAHAGR
jgi:hypothetical protein